MADYYIFFAELRVLDFMIPKSVLNFGIVYGLSVLL